MPFVNLGGSGLKVSEMCLGVGQFGTAAHVATPEDEARRIVDAYLDAGHNFVDTADGYERGQSEEVLGRALQGRRDGVIIATKAHLRVGPGPNDRGLSRAHLVKALEGSLRRLRTDYVDLYQCHSVDPDTPIEETMATLDGFVKAGKVRYLGCSNFPGSRIVEAQWAAERAGGTPFVSLQSRYSLVYREIEADALATAERHGLGLLAYSPLAGGVLTGKYRRGDEPPADSRALRVEGVGAALAAFRSNMTNERNLTISEAVTATAAGLGITAVTLSIAWLRARRGVTSVIIGPRTHQQYEDYQEGFRHTLDRTVVEHLDDMTAPAT